VQNDTQNSGGFKAISNGETGETGMPVLELFERFVIMFRNQFGIAAVKRMISFAIKQFDDGSIARCLLRAKKKKKKKKKKTDTKKKTFGSNE
jgi:hypothetical protein